MDVTSEEAQRLLGAVRDVSERAGQARRLADALAGLRREAVQDAMDAGLPREDIAKAAGVHRNVLYQIVKKDGGRK